jgi:peptidoglycan/xylan/chitin deacetylase (PgdA/CDA1 family)
MDKFTIKYYEKMLESFKQNNYKFIFFDDIKSIKNPNKKIVLLRHDIDFNPYKVKEICEIEKKHNVKSTYFFLLNSKFYNLHNIQIYNIIKQIVNEGNEIGVHFDESSYTYSNNKEISRFITKEIKFFEGLFRKKIKIISFHRPTNNVLLNKINIPIAHTYQEIYAKQIKYLSDSKKQMPEGDFIEIINSGKYKKIQLLIHPFWWNETYTDTKEDYEKYIKFKNREIRKAISDNSKIFNYNEEDI